MQGPLPGAALLGGLVNCAAITARGEEMEPGFFARVVDVNLHGTFRAAVAFHPHLRASAGALVNIGSMYASFGSPRNPAYGASKAAAVRLTRSLAIAWAAEGIRVNAVAPSAEVRTSLLSARRPSSRSAWATQLRIACADGSNPRANSAGSRPARTRSTIWRRNSGA